MPVNLDHLYKKNFGKMVLGLLKHIGIQNLEQAEDIVQETFLAAYENWQTDVPENPEAWLFKVCKNKAFNSFREKRQQEKYSRQVSNETISWQLDTSFEMEVDSGPLQLLVACANPLLSHRQQVVFALRYVAGFKVDQIASLLITPADAVTKMLQRTRDLIRKQQIQLLLHSDQFTSAQKQTVVKILYLMFSEGYKTSRGKTILNIELCEDALSFTQSVVKSKNLVSPEAKALLALMLFDLSRFDARFNAEGDIIDLENQDRSLWQHELIKVGTTYLNEARTDVLTSYHIEATIAYLHCSAPAFQSTDWNKIVTLYSKLQSINESPFVKLSLAIAQFYAGDVSNSLIILEELGSITYVNRYYLYQATLGKVFRGLGQTEKAQFHLENAFNLASHDLEKKYIANIIRCL